MSEQQPQQLTDTFRSVQATNTWYSHITEHEIELYLYEHQIKFSSLFYEDIPEPHIYGIRKSIKNFSRASRLRLMKFLASLPFSDLGVSYFVTLTYHNSWPDSQHLVKRDLHDFFIYLLRLYPHLSYIWKLEYQKRGAPHFHLVLFVPDEVDKKFSYKLKRDIAFLWLRFNHCGCYWCQQHAVKVQRIQSFKRLSFYVSKYMAKEDWTERPEGTGRFWGRSKNLYARARVKAMVDVHTFYEIREKLLKVLRQRRSKYNYYIETLDNKFNFFVFIDDEEFKQIYEIIEQSMRPPPTPPPAQKN